MKESSKPIVLYSKVFKQNQKETLDKLFKLQEQGMIHVFSYTDFFKIKDKPLKLIRSLDDIEDIVKSNILPLVYEMNLNDFIEELRKNPDKYLTSFIVLFRYANTNENRYKDYDTQLSDLKNIINRMEEGSW